MSAIEVRPVSGGVGVELANVNIGGGLSDAEFATKLLDRASIGIHFDATEDLEVLLPTLFTDF